MPSDVPAPASAAPMAHERAEALLDQAGERLGRWSSSAYFQLRKAAALVREEAEDIWAEAQAMRTGSETPTPQPQAESEPA
jgi:hypothetical protein